ncbi:Smr/MutS family protein [Paracoccus albus]|uniref:Smr/MutS family protein n=1 Tax=Paracoccus albus TaxID=3017784 RepID=UPI0022F07109|nr:Smr/MutS family protein [Paracoccus albus]WBU60057.1 Smr/MutS family protein [Paracoccus albus]
MSRRRGLTPEDRELWSRVARTATPLEPKSRSVMPDASPEPKLKSPVRSARASVALAPDFGVGSKAGTRRGNDLAPSPADALSSQPIRMDHRTHRQMSRGKMRPEAKLDLHGMTLAEAGPELARFILSCHSRGFRLVLVITGKGSSGNDGPLPVRRGALRHQVPYWLHAPPISHVVQQVAPAHLRHGGAGAYYVYLRR